MCTLIKVCHNTYLFPAQIWRPYVKRFSRESADRRTDGQADRRDHSITSTADAGGNKRHIGSTKQFPCGTFENRPGIPGKTYL